MPDDDNQNSTPTNSPGEVVVPVNHDEPKAVENEANTTNTNIETPPAETIEKTVPTELDLDKEVIWEAPEFIDRTKSTSWYLTIFISSVVLGGLLYLFTKDLITVFVVFLAVIIFGAYGIRRPKNINYKIDEYGIGVGQKYFHYEEFRFFSAEREGNYMNVTLIPLKRFSPPIGLCFMATDEKVLSYLTNKLPFEQHHTDILENILKRINF